MSMKNFFAWLLIVALCVTFAPGCTTVTRSDGSTVRIPAAGYVGAMAAANITCQDNVQSLLAENAKLKARIVELEAKLNEPKK
jgi:hypothetical protein